MLANLVSNAVKFTEEGHVLVAVTNEDQSDGTARFRVTVEDTGIGISEEKLAHIFKKFAQADSSTTRRFGGTGLGLAISKQLVELMDGQIGATSLPGEGSTFWFTLDLALVAEAVATNEMAAEPSREAQSTLPPATARPIRARVLVAEDNIVNQKVAVRMLERLGCRVDVAANGKDAVEMVSRFPYDLVFMDCLMPEMDGFEATGEIRKLQAGRGNLPIIAMTALTIEGDSQRCMAAGMNDYLSKPVRPEGVRAVLECWTQTSAREVQQFEHPESQQPARPCRTNLS